MKNESDKVNLMQLNKLGLKTTDKEFEVYKMFNSWSPHGKESIEQASLWIEKLIKANQKTKIYNEEALLKEVARRWFQICNNSTFNGIWGWNKFYKNPISGSISLTLKKKIKYFIKCFLNYGKKYDVDIY